MKYSITNDDKKMIHFFGEFYDAYDGTETTYRRIDYLGVILPLKKFLVMDENDIVDLLDNATQTIQEISIEEQQRQDKNYFEESGPGIYLPLEYVNLETPCGDYRTE